PASRSACDACRAAAGRALARCTGRRLLRPRPLARRPPRARSLARAATTGALGTAAGPLSLVRVPRFRAACSREVRVARGLRRDRRAEGEKPLGSRPKPPQPDRDIGLGAPPG